MTKRFKKGAASFYIVAFSTLILMIVAISFAAVIISEVERTSNDDLSQSAYDSALAGIEDAKLAYYNYMNCKNNKKIDGAATDGSCSEIVRILDTDRTVFSSEDCNMVWDMLKRDTSGNMVESNTSSNNMQQFTTCVTMNNILPNYDGSLSASRMMDIISPKFGTRETEISSDKINKIVVRWYSREDADRSGVYFNNKNTFPSVNTPAIAPPIISFTVLQSGSDFTMDSFNEVSGDTTNRGMVYLVPVDGVNSGVENNVVKRERLVKSNTKKNMNEAVKIGCDKNSSEFLCSATIDLPKPVGGVRKNETFKIIMSMPYGQPSTRFLLEFYCSDTVCASGEPTNEGSDSEAAVAPLKDVQIEVDSTGRANDLYRRVVARLKSKDDLSLTVMGPLELLGSDSNDGLRKNWPVTSEHNFWD